jgi:hypothetical protein
MHMPMLTLTTSDARGGLFNVFIVNNQLYFLTKELSVVVGATHVRSSRDLHPLSHVRCLPEEVLKATLSIRDTVRLSLCRAAQNQGVTDCKEIYMTKTAWIMIMHDMQAFPSHSHPIHMVHTNSPPVSCPEMDFTQDGLLEMNNYYDNFETEFRCGDNIPKLYRVRIYTQEQMMFLQRELRRMFGVGARKRFGKAHEMTFCGLPVMGATILNLLTHLKTESDVEQVQLQKGKYRSRGLDGLSLQYDKNSGKMTIRVCYKDFSIAEAIRAGHYPFGVITPILPNEPSPAVGFCFFTPPSQTCGDSSALCTLLQLSKS